MTASRTCKCLLPHPSSEDRIKQRGPIASDVNLDVQIFKPKIRLNLLDEITRKKHGKLH